MVIPRHFHGSPGAHKLALGVLKAAQRGAKVFFPTPTECIVKAQTSSASASDGRRTAVEPRVAGSSAARRRCP